MVILFSHESIVVVDYLRKLREFCGVELAEELFEVIL